MIKLRALFLCVLSCLMLLGILTTSCQTDAPATAKKDNNKPNIVTAIEQNFTNVLDIPTAPISSKHNIRRIKIPDTGNDSTQLYIYIDSLYQHPKVTRMRDLLTLINDYGASVSTDPDQPHSYVYQISETDAKAALSPMIAESKRYLYSLGFSDNEIQTLLTENNLNEAALIKIVLSANEYEGNSGAYGTLLPIGSDKYLTEEDQYYIQSINWEKVRNCAYMVSIVGIIGEIAHSGVRFITKEVIKNAVKRTAVHMLGSYASVAFTVFEFSVCYFT